MGESGPTNGAIWGLCGASEPEPGSITAVSGVISKIGAGILIGASDGTWVGWSGGGISIGCEFCVMGCGLEVAGIGLSTGKLTGSPKESKLPRSEEEEEGSGE